MSKPLFKLVVIHFDFVPFYTSRLGGEGGNAFSCDVLIFRPAHHPCKHNRDNQGLQFLAALNRFQRLIVLRQHIRESILAFDEVADEFETHPDLYDTQTALHITNMRLNLHNLCQRITTSNCSPAN